MSLCGKKNVSLRFYCNNGYVKAPQYYVIRILPVLRYRVDDPSLK